MAIVVTLRKLRTDNNIKLKEIAAATGIESATISRLENNKTSGADFTTLDKIIGFFQERGIDCNIGDILTYTKNQATPSLAAGADTPVSVPD